jgi:hypothetical protein
MRFAFIAAEKAVHAVTILCRCLRVTRTGFSAWSRRVPRGPLEHIRLYTGPAGPRVQN